MMTTGTGILQNGCARAFGVARSVFLTAVLALVSGAAFAAAPTGDWVVGPIYASSSSGKSFCSMKNTYDNGYSIVFARDVTGGNSIALTLDRQALSAGSQYYATFIIGPISRMMVSIAATKQILITQMGDDPDFYEMLALKDKLYVEFNGDRLVFDLRGTAKALEQLGTCADTVGLGDKFTAVNVAAVTSADASPLPEAPKHKPMSELTAEALAQNKDLKLSEQALGSSILSEVEDLRREKERLQRENQAIAARLHASDLETAQIEAARLAEFERKERALMIENARLKERLAKAKQGKGMPTISDMPVPPPAAETAAPAPAAVAGETAVAAYTPPPVPNQPQSNLAGSKLADWARRAAGAPAAVEMPPAETGIRAWRWQTGDIYVALQELPFDPATGLQAAAEHYIDTIRQRCTGDFARKLAAVRPFADGVQAATGELACINDTQDAAAGLAFITHADRMVVVTYESATDNMPDMLSMRDIFISKVYSGQFTF